MGLLSRQRIGGGIILLVAGWLGRESLSWLFGKALDFASGGVRTVSLAAFPWQNALATLLALLGGYLAFWPRTRVAKPDMMSVLFKRSQNIVSRVRQQRRATHLDRQYRGLEPLGDVVRDGCSTLLIFEREGFAVPDFDTTEPERLAFGLETYFATLSPLIRDRHIDIAKGAASEIANNAAKDAKALTVETWHGHD